MEKINFCLPRFFIDDVDALVIFEDAGYRPDYDVFNDWLEKFFKAFVNNFNRTDFFSFLVKYVDIYIEEGSWYSILVECNRDDLYKYFDENLIDTKENYDVEQLLRDINVNPIYGDDAFIEAYDGDLDYFMEKIKNKTITEEFPPLEEEDEE